MKKMKTFIIAGILITTSASAQIKSPKPSPTAEIEQVVGLTEIEVEYSRPGMKGRKIFGDLVKYGEVWRTGANASTKIEISDDIKVNGKELKQGEYSLYAIPGETEWTIIFNKNLDLWGSAGYKQEEDALRITAKPTKLNDAVESFTIDFGNFTYSGAQMMLKWENTQVAFEIETNANEQVENQIKKELIDGPDAGSYAAAAGYYLENNKNMEQALEFINKAVEKRADAFWYVHNQAVILGKLGKKKEAIEAAKKSMELAKANKDGDYGYVAKNEALIKELGGK